MAWINLRHEIDILLNGGRDTVAQGYWIIVRIFRIGELSQYWDYANKEAIGGPKYNYDDFLCRAVSLPGQRLSNLRMISDGLMEIAHVAMESFDNHIFAIEHNANMPRYPDRYDLVYKIDKYESVDPPDPPFIVRDRYKVINSVPEYGDHGRAEVIYCLGARVHGES